MLDGQKHHYRIRGTQKMNAVAKEIFRSSDRMPCSSTNNNEGRNVKKSNSTRNRLDINDKRRMWFSTKTETSLLDEEDEEFGVLDSLGERLTEDENSSITSSNPMCTSPQADTETTVLKDCDDNVGPGSHLVRFSENVSNMATFLCPVDFIASTNDVSPPSNQSYVLENTLHERQLSETDSLQKLASSGPCGGNSLFPSLRSLDSQETDTTPSYYDMTMIDPSVACTDVDLLGMRRLIVTDILTLLSSPQGESWVCSMHRWLQDEPITKFPIVKRKGIQNRCSYPRANSRRIRELWFRWHGHSTDWNVTFGNVDGPIANNNTVAKSFDDTGVFSHNTPPVDVIDCFYDSDPETFSSMKRTTGFTYQPSLIVTDASFGSTGHGAVPSTPKASNCNRCPSFDTPSPPQSNLSLDADDFVVGLTDAVQKFDLWDDQIVKNFVQVRRHTVYYSF
jgi:hypothetical protein